MSSAFFPILRGKFVIYKGANSFLTSGRGRKVKGWECLWLPCLLRSENKEVKEMLRLIQCIHLKGFFSGIRRDGTSNFSLGFLHNISIGHFGVEKWRVSKRERYPKACKIRMYHVLLKFGLLTFFNWSRAYARVKLELLKLRPYVTFFFKKLNKALLNIYILSILYDWKILYAVSWYMIYHFPRLMGYVFSALLAKVFPIPISQKRIGVYNV